MAKARKLRRGSRLGKYRIEGLLGEGGFATVYRAYDTIEGVRVALKVPHQEHVDEDLLAEFRNEVRLTARLDHPNILKIKNATFINDRFVVAYPLGERTLEERLRKRISTAMALEFWHQAVAALAHAHRHRVIHCDVKPDNLLIFPENRLLLTDFGISKLARHTVHTASGTLGYMAPEQAMGRTSFRSDVFSAGLVGYRLFSGVLPEWPFEWPPEGISRVREKLPAAGIEVIRKALRVDPRQRFENADAMRAAMERALPGPSTVTETPWQKVRWQQFMSEFGNVLELGQQCSTCSGPVGQAMFWCPWCGDDRARVRKPARGSRACSRCRRTLKGDWTYCPWCYGGAAPRKSARTHSDERYTARCADRRCSRKELMPFMRYCPWCRSKVKKAWNVAGSRDRCSKCRWGIASDYWDYCPWCGSHDHG